MENKQTLPERLREMLEGVRVKKASYKFNPKGKYINIWITSYYDTTLTFSLRCENDAQAEIIYDWLNKKILKDLRG